MWATLTTNIAANIVAPTNAFVNVAPSSLTFNMGALITAVLGAAIMPWKLVRLRVLVSHFYFYVPYSILSMWR